jgi:hypothetical protein
MAIGLRAVPAACHGRSAAIPNCFPTTEARLWRRLYIGRCLFAHGSLPELPRGRETQRRGDCHFASIMRRAERIRSTRSCPFASASARATACRNGKLDVRRGIRRASRGYKYEVTVGRFRQFVNAFNVGWIPAPGSGKHSHLNGGLGLVHAGASTADGAIVYESGWNTGT